MNASVITQRSTSKIAEKSIRRSTTRATEAVGLVAVVAIAPSRR